MIQFHHLSKSYESGARTESLFKNTDFQITKGSLTAIKGRSGSGKSTLLRLLSGLDVQYSGNYYFNQIKMKRNLTVMADFRLHNIGIITQHYELLNDRNCIDNIAFPLKCMKMEKKIIQKKVAEIMDLMDMTDIGTEYPFNLSGGQCQRVAIARAAVKSPKLLLADEPTGALDIQAEQQVMNFLKDYLSGSCTIVVATHSPNIAEWCETVLEIKDKKVT